MRSRPRMAKTQALPHPNQYVVMLGKDYKDWAYDEETVVHFKGQWRQKAFQSLAETPLDVEIGTGNGFHFAHRAQVAPGRLLVGLELKYKPLIQSIRRSLRQGSTNARVARYHASLLDELFDWGEINNVYIHFPDPWPKKKHLKNRLMNTNFFNLLFGLQKPGSFVEIKTDSADYFQFASACFRSSPYQIEEESRDLHQSPYQERNFETHFESIFRRQKLSINYALLRKPLKTNDNIGSVHCFPIDSR